MSTRDTPPGRHRQTVEEPAIDFLEDPTIDGPEPVTREEFSRDSKSDSYTVDRPPRPIGEQGSASLGESTVKERTTE